MKMFKPGGLCLYYLCVDIKELLIRLALEIIPVTRLDNAISTRHCKNIKV